MAKAVIEPSWLDRVIASVAPATATQRLRSRAVWSLTTGQGGYHGGRRDRRPTRGWRPQPESANAAILPDLPDLRARSRDLERNVPIATGAVATSVTAIVGDGVRVYPACDHEFLGLSREDGRDWNRAALREFMLAAATVDWTRVQSFDELQALALGATLSSGDCLVVRRYRSDPGDVYGLKLQLIEADRVSNPGFTADSETMAGGVEHDDTGVPVAFHVSAHHPGALSGAGRGPWVRVPVRDAAGEVQVLHLLQRLRPDQARGVPYLAPVIDMVKQLGDYTDAEVRAAVIAAFLALFVTRSDADSDVKSPIVGTEDSADGVGDTAKEIGLPEGGAMVDLLPGESIQSPIPGRPNEKFDPFVQSLLRQIGVALELPYELLIKHFAASYSASRAALELAYQTFRRRRQWLVRRFNQPVYEWVIDEAVARGRLAAPGYFSDPAIRAAYVHADWIGQPRFSIDPLKDANADRIDIETGVKTRQQVCVERTGGDYDSKHGELADEERRRREDGLGTGGSAIADDTDDADPAEDPDEEEDDET
jgi:lambda family phage portal protein